MRSYHLMKEGNGTARWRLGFGHNRAGLVKKSAGLAWLMLLGVICGWSKSEPPTMTVELAPEKAYLGDRVSYMVTFGHGEGWQIVTDLLPDKLGEASLLDQQWDSILLAEEGPTVQRFQATLAFYKLGENEVPKQVFKAIGPNGEETDLIAPALPMTIEALLEGQDQALADNKGQVSMNVPFFWLMLILGLVVLVLLVWLVFYLRSRRKPKLVPTEPPKPAYAEALDRLAVLTNGTLLKEGKIKAFYVEIHLIIRHYFHRLFDIPAEEMTSFEFEDWLLPEARVPDQTKQICGEFQLACDQVKFAKYDPVESETKDLVNHAYQIVEQIRPKPQEVSVVSTG